MTDGCEGQSPEDAIHGPVVMAQIACMRRSMLNNSSAGQALYDLFVGSAWQEAVGTSLSLDGFEGQDCHLGLHLASRTDLAAVALVFPSKDVDTCLLVALQ